MTAVRFVTRGRRGGRDGQAAVLHRQRPQHDQRGSDGQQWRSPRHRHIRQTPANDTDRSNAQVATALLADDVNLL